MDGLTFIFVVLCLASANIWGVIIWVYVTRRLDNAGLMLIQLAQILAAMIVKKSGEETPGSLRALGKLTRHISRALPHPVIEDILNNVADALG